MCRESLPLDQAKVHRKNDKICPKISQMAIRCGVNPPDKRTQFRPGFASAAASGHSGKN